MMAIYSEYCFDLKKQNRKILRRSKQKEIVDCSKNHNNYDIRIMLLYIINKWMKNKHLIEFIFYILKYHFDVIINN